MKSSELVKAFIAHIDSLENAETVMADGEMALLLGTDEFKLNRKKGSVKIPGSGWIRYPALIGNADAVDWVAVLPGENGGDCKLVLGQGNPYERPQCENLPMIEGAVQAMPINLNGAPRPEKRGIGVFRAVQRLISAALGTEPRQAA